MFYCLIFYFVSHMTEKEVLQNEFWKFWQPIRQLSGKVKYEKKKKKLHSVKFSAHVIL